jgi:hypothetical protein
MLAVCCGPAAPEPDPPQFNVIAGTGTPTQEGASVVEFSARPAPSTVIEPNGRGAFSLLGNRLVLVTPGSSVPALPPDDVGAVKALAALPGALFAATDRGLYRWKPTQTPPWTRFSLAGDGALDVQVDARTGSVWVTSPSALFRIDGDAVTYFSPAK